MAQTQRKKKEEQMRLLVARYTESGQSMAAFCKSSGTVGHVLRYWVRKYGGASAGVLRAGFREIKVVSPPVPAAAATATGNGIVLETPSGITLHFPADYSVEALAGIIRCLTC